MAEQLQQPAFNKEELDKVLKRREAGFKKSKESTWNNAFNDVLKNFYGEDHQNSPLSPEAGIEELKTISAEDLRVFHSKNYGVGSMVVVAVGDVDHKTLSNIIQKNFAKWKQSPIKEKMKKERVNQEKDKNI